MICYTYHTFVKCFCQRLFRYCAKNIVYSGSKTNVKMTMIDGKILYEDGKFAEGINAEDIYAKANVILERLR